MSDTVSIALKLRQLVIKMLTAAGSGHTAGSLGMADVFAVLYFSDLLHLDPQDPDHPERDRVILSNGHICPVWYAALAKRGFFPVKELVSLRQFGSRLQGHPHRDFSPTSPSATDPASSPSNLPGIENTSGPLGQGTSFAVGLALGLRLLHQQHQLTRLPQVICLLSDGELDEGQVWEAFMSAVKFKLNHLMFIIDRNDIQIDGFTHDVMPLESLKDRCLSFGFNTVEVDGHNHTSIYQAIKVSSERALKPTVIIAHTTPGKGVSFIEGKFEWHGKAPNAEESEQALQELIHA